MFTFDEISFTQKPAKPSHRCIDIDFPRGVCHRDCTGCGAVVYVEQDGPTYGEYSIDPLEGGRCSDCSETYCSDCMTDNTPSGDRKCRGCAETEANAFYEKNALGERIVRARNELEGFIERLRREPDPKLIRASIFHVDAINELVETINNELCPNIERAMGQQLTLPGAAA